jgi:hypothetical protein
MGTLVGGAIGDEDGEEVFPPFRLKVTGSGPGIVKLTEAP